jgi:hypothetical protein
MACAMPWTRGCAAHGNLRGGVVDRVSVSITKSATLRLVSWASRSTRRYIPSGKITTTRVAMPSPFPLRWSPLPTPALAAAAPTLLWGQLVTPPRNNTLRVHPAVPGFGLAPYTSLSSPLSSLPLVFVVSLGYRRGDARPGSGDGESTNAGQRGALGVFGPTTARASELSPDHSFGELHYSDNIISVTAIGGRKT